MKDYLPLWRRALVLTIAFTCVSLLAWAQERTIRGVVTDGETSEGLPGVNVVVKGTTIGTITDIEGNYTLSVPSDANTLVFSSVGYSAEEVDINNRSTIDLNMMPDIQSLSEVVVVGYGTQEKRDVTAAIASLDKEQISKIPVASGVQAMQGQVAGVDIQAQGGRPGQNVSVQIRGRRSLTASNEPLYVIDGIPQTSSSSAIFDINPQDIESMEILKDAAATAIYGSRGANGVILITTKRGKQGRTVVSYDGYYGVSEALNTVDMMNGPEFAAMKRESRRWDPETRLIQHDGVIPADELVFEDPIELESLAQGRSTDYQDLVLNSGWQTNHQLSVTGGSEKTQFNISLGYFDEQGIIENMDYQRLTARVNLDHKLNDIFKVGTSTLISSSTQNWGSGATLGEAISNNPLGVPFAEDGSLRFLPTNDGIRTNPLNEVVEGAYVDERRFTRIFVPLYLEANIVEGLKYRANFGPDIRFRRRGLFRASLTNNNRGGPADASIENEYDLGYTLENILTYNKTFGEHTIGVTALQSIQALRSEEHETNVENLPYETQLFYNLGTAEVKGDLRSELEEWQLASFMGRFNYDLSGKYLFQATLRADGSSRLAPGNKWAYFPGLSAGWRIVDEGFMSGANFLSELKLRVSYGAVGNTSVDPYQTFGRLRRTTYAWDESPAFGFGLNEIPNPNLGWEITSTVNVGFDYGLFNNRLFGTLDIFESNTNDMLLERALPFTSGYQDILQNIGSTRTSGVELGLNGVIIDKPEGLNWTVNLNISRVTEEITELALTDPITGEPADDIGNDWFIGQPVRVFFDYEKEGIYQLGEEDLARDREQKVPGEIKLVDQDGDGVITPADRIVLGSDVPEFHGGLTNNFSYKGFDFSFFLFYRVGHMIQSNFHSGNNTLFARYNNLDVDYWTINNPTNESPRPNQNQERPRNGSTLTYFDGSFIKLRNVTLGYNLPQTLTDKVGLSRVRLYASGQNLWFASEYDTFDPENNDNISIGDIPSNRLILFGINASF